MVQETSLSVASGTEQVVPATRDKDTDVESHIVCPICYESFPSATDTEEPADLETGVSSAQRLIALVRVSEDCSHQVCRSCLAEYCHVNVTTRKYPILCPCHGDRSGCEATLTLALVKRMLFEGGPPDGSGDDIISQRAKNNAEWQKYERFQRLAQDPTLMSCPRCDELCSPTLSDGMEPSSQDLELSRTDSEASVLSCASCRHTFCSIHGDAHPNLSCRSYLRSQQAKQVKKSEKALRRFTKPCSHCGSYIQKFSGCDHVVCPACGQDMCFKCGTHEYLTGKAIRNCSKCHQGFIDHRYNFRFRLRLLAYLPCLFPLIVIYCAVVGVAFLLSGFFCCCFCCGTQCPPSPPHQGAGESSSSSSTHSTTTKSTKNADKNDPLAKRPDRPRMKPLQGISRAFAVVFLPVLLVFHEFGCESNFVNDLLETPLQEELPEIPTMTLDEADGESN